MEEEAGLAPSDDQSTLKLVVTEDAEEGLDESGLVELGASTLLTDSVAGVGGEESVSGRRWEG